MAFYPKTSTLPKQVGSIGDNFKNVRSARQCNCKRSNCLKLYCECFANGVYCNPKKCNCNNCFNNNENEVHRRTAVELTMDRNPNAFRPKIVAAVQDGDGSTRHHKGCHCKKSNCLKKYCECFQASTVCSDRCRCSECKNFLGSVARVDYANKNIQNQRGMDFRHDAEAETNTSGSAEYPQTSAIEPSTGVVNRNLMTSSVLESHNHYNNDSVKTGRCASFGTEEFSSNASETTRHAPAPVRIRQFEPFHTEDVLNDQAIAEVCKALLRASRKGSNHRDTEIPPAASSSPLMKKLRLSPETVAADECPSRGREAFPVRNATVDSDFKLEGGSASLLSIPVTAKIESASTAPLSSARSINASFARISSSASLTDHSSVSKSVVGEPSVATSGTSSSSSSSSSSSQAAVLAMFVESMKNLVSLSLLHANSKKMQAPAAPMSLTRESSQSAIAITIPPTTSQSAPPPCPPREIPHLRSLPYMLNMRLQPNHISEPTPGPSAAFRADAVTAGAPVRGEDSAKSVTEKSYLLPLLSQTPLFPETLPHMMERTPSSTSVLSSPTMPSLAAVHCVSKTIGVPANTLSSGLSSDPPA